MAETQSVVNIQDIAEYLKPYRSALLNAAYAQVFTPEYIQSQFPNASFVGGSPSVPPPQTAPDYLNQYVPPPQPTYIQLEEVAPIGPGREREEGRSRYGYAAGGQTKLGESSQSIEDYLSALQWQDVSLSPGGSPLGWTYPGLNVSPTPQFPANIGTGVRTPPPPVPPNIVGGPGNIINTPPSPGTLTPTVLGGGGAPTPQQPQGANGLAPAFVNQRPANFAGAAQAQSMGYNPAPTPQQPQGANGLAPAFVNQRPANFAGAAQAQSMGYNPAQYAEESVAQRLARGLGAQGVTYTNPVGAIAPPAQAQLDFGGTNQHNAGLINDIYARSEGNESHRQQMLDALRKEIMQYGGTPGFKHGGVVKFAEGGFSGGAPNLGGVGSLNQTQNPFSGTAAGGAFGAIRAPQPYGYQRILGMDSSFGQQSPTGTFQASNLTQNALTNAGGIPSYFQNGFIRDDRDEQGRATTNFGIANDTFDTAGNMAIGAAANSQYMSGLSPLRSTFQDTMSYLQANPQNYSAGDITLGQLQAPQLDAPMAVSAPQLTGYQMAGPQLIDTSTARVGADRIGTDRFIDPGNPEAWMSPYKRNVIDVQKQKAVQDFGEARAGRNANAIRAGAFGGSRQAVADSIADRDLQTQLAQIEATGMQSGYENAQQQYERDRAANLGVQQFNASTGLQAGLANQGVGMQGALANQGALQNANAQNLAAILGVQQLGAGQSLQAQLANQAAGLQAGQSNQNAALQTQQLGRTTGLSAAQSNQATRAAQNQQLLDAFARADQLQQQAAQGNFSNQLNAIGQQTNSSLAANTIGQSRADLQRLAQAMEWQNIQQQLQAGNVIDQRTQQALDLGYQDYINQMNHPYQQMNWLQGLLAGVPMGYNQEQVIFNRTNPASQITGLATAGLGALSNYYGRTN